MRFPFLATAASNHGRKITGCAGENLPKAYLPHTLYCPQTLVGQKAICAGRWHCTVTGSRVHVAVEGPGLPLWGLASSST